MDMIESEGGRGTKSSQYIISGLDLSHLLDKKYSVQVAYVYEVLRWWNGNYELKLGSTD